jgi:hypothetical protein
MSLISWLSKRNPKLVDGFEKPKLPGLPDPSNAATPTEGSSCEAADEEIETAVRKSSASAKRGPYGCYYIVHRRHLL